MPEHYSRVLITLQSKHQGLQRNTKFHPLYPLLADNTHMQQKNVTSHFLGLAKHGLKAIMGIWILQYLY
jgi:hypothetical protein